MSLTLIYDHENYSYISSLSSYNTLHSNNFLNNYITGELFISSSIIGYVKLYLHETYGNIYDLEQLDGIIEDFNNITIICDKNTLDYCVNNYVCKNIYIFKHNIKLNFNDKYEYVSKDTYYTSNAEHIYVLKFKYKNNFESKYFKICQKILNNSNERNDRTGTGTYSSFGERLKIDISKEFPIMSTKRVFWRGVVEELLWFLRGSTNAKELQDNKIRIWDGNSTREFLDKNGLSHLNEGDLGEVYGFQWNHFGAEYKDCNTNYDGQGINQIENVIEMIKTNPNSRRILVSAWNPASLSNCALPPCHVLFQFYVNNNKLSCQMYQRSADMFLGVPFNIASYALLTYMIAYLTNLEPGELIMVFGDAHVYKNAVEQMKVQMKRIPYSYPMLQVNTQERKIESIRDFRYEDFSFTSDNSSNKYKCHPPIKAKMAI